MKTCEHCGSELALNSVRGGYTDCLNRDCIWTWYGTSELSLVGIRRSLMAELEREPVSRFSQDAIIIPRIIAKRLAEVLSDLEDSPSPQR